MFGVCRKPGVLESAAFPLWVSSSRQKRINSFVISFILASDRTLHDAEHLVKKVLSLLSPVSLSAVGSSASWRSEPCDAQFSKVCGQQFPVNRDSLKLASKEMLCLAESGQ